MDEQLLKVALRVLNCYATLTQPDPGDVAILRSATPSSDGKEPPDALAVAIVDREIQRLRAARAGGNS